MMIFILLLCCTVNAANMPEFPFIVVKGSAETKIKPDQAKISFSVTEFNVDPKKAELVVLQRGQEILALAKNLGISKENVTSSEYNKSTTRKKDEHYNSLEILGYEIRQSFTVNINIESYTTFTDRLISMKNIDNIRPEFDISNRSEIKNQLIQQATNNAKLKASNLAAGMGVKLGAVFAVSQDYDFAGINAVFSSSRENGGFPPPDFIPPPSLDFVPDSEGSTAMMFVPKYLEISTSVSAIYKIK